MQCMGLTGISVMNNIQKVKYTVDVVYVNLVRDMVCRQLEIRIFPQESRFSNT